MWLLQSLYLLHFFCEQPVPVGICVCYSCRGLSLGWHKFTDSFIRACMHAVVLEACSMWQASTALTGGGTEVTKTGAFIQGSHNLLGKLDMKRWCQSCSLEVPQRQIVLGCHLTQMFSLFINPPKCLRLGTFFALSQQTIMSNLEEGFAQVQREIPYHSSLVHQISNYPRTKQKHRKQNTKSKWSCLIWLKSHSPYVGSFVYTIHCFLFWKTKYLVYLLVLLCFLLLFFSRILWGSKAEVWSTPLWDLLGPWYEIHPGPQTGSI